MTIGGSYYGGARRRGRAPAMRGVVGWTLAIILVLSAGIYAYRTGTVIAMQDADALRAELTVVTDAIADLEQSNTGLRLALEEQQRRNLELADQYQRDIPNETIRHILELTRGHLEAGVDPERLEEVIGAMPPEWRCESEPDSRRFVIQTPTTSGANDVVVFAGGLVTVRGAGVSKLNAEGLPLAWFDPAQPVTLVFTLMGGESTDVTGVLPLSHSVVVDQMIHRFSIVSGETSFVKVTGIPCSYP